MMTIAVITVASDLSKGTAYLAQAKRRYSLKKLEPKIPLQPYVCNGSQRRWRHDSEVTAVDALTIGDVLLDYFSRLEPPLETIILHRIDYFRRYKDTFVTVIRSREQKYLIMYQYSRDLTVHYMENVSIPLLWTQLQTSRATLVPRYRGY